MAPPRSVSPRKFAAALDNRLAILTRRKIPVVHRILQIVLGLVNPELRYLLECMNDGILEPSANEFHLAQSCDKPLTIFGFSTDGFERALELEPRHVRAFGIV